MKASVEEASSANIPFSFEERVLIRSSSTTEALKPSSSSTTAKTVRLESLAQWKKDAWVHPFSDIDIGLSSSGSDTDDYHNKISRVRMSISSHGTQRFPTDSNGLDHIPVLPTWKDEVDRNDDDDERYLSIPQGFFLSIRPVNGLTPEEEARAVQAVFEELIRTRLLTTPVTGGEWDIVEDTVEGGQQNSSSPRLYQLILPFDGAAWSSDALAQSFRGTLPKVCGNGENDRFFGWSALEWSNFLVGYKGGGGELGKGNKQSLQYLTYDKLMWWTWTSSSSSSKEQSLSFGIQYQTTIPSDANDWLPDNFLDETSKCPIGKRNVFEVLPPTSTNTADGHQLVPITRKNENELSEEESLVQASKFLYSVGIEQVLRRHHTNQGRFESSIDLNPLFYLDTVNSASCRMIYRQVFPDFLTPMWRSLRVIDGDTDETGAVGNAFYSNSDQLKASVEWDPDDQRSTLTVEAVSGPNNTESTPSFSFLTLPSNVFISLEYAPSFLTIDDFPGDPNRGRVLPPASVTVRCDTSTMPQPHNAKTVVYSNSLLLLPPVPDLSMPFNVISLTSSLYAYIVGAIITILVRKGSEEIKYKMYPEKKPESKLTKLKSKLREKVGRVRQKLFGKDNGNSNQKGSPGEGTVDETETAEEIKKSSVTQSE